MNNSESSSSWYGWLWTGDTWERVCAGDNPGECSRRLSEEARRRGIRTDQHGCMTGGKTRLHPLRRKGSDPGRRK